MCAVAPILVWFHLAISGQVLPDPQSAGVLDKLGRAELDAGRFQNALRYFERELRVADLDGRDRGTALSNAARSCLALGQNRRSEQYFREALALIPDDSTLWHGQGQALFLQHKSEAAEAAYRRSLAIDAANAAALNDLGLVLIARRKTPEAISVVRAAVESTPPGRSRARMMRNLAILQCHAGSCGPASDILREAINEMEAAVGPNHFETAQLLADYSDVLAKIGSKTASRDAAQRARSIRSTFAGQSGDGLVDWRELRK